MFNNNIPLWLKTKGVFSKRWDESGEPGYFHQNHPFQAIGVNVMFANNSILSDLLDFNSTWILTQACVNQVVLGDFNLKPTNLIMLNFLSNQNFANLIKSNTVFPETSTGPQISAAPLGIHIEISPSL